MLQSISSVFIVYRHKTLTGSPDPMHANGTDKPCMSQESQIVLKNSFIALGCEIYFTTFNQNLMKTIGEIVTG